MRRRVPYSPLDRFPRWQQKTVGGVLLLALTGCGANQAPSAAIEEPTAQGNVEPAVQAPPKSVPPQVGLTPNNPDLCKTISVDTLAGWMKSKPEMTPRTRSTCSPTPTAQGKTALPLAGGLLAYAVHDLPGAVVNRVEIMAFNDASPTEPSRYDGLEERYPGGVEAVTGENGFVAKYVGKTGTTFVKLVNGTEVVDVSLSATVNQAITVGNSEVIQAGVRNAQKMAIDDVVGAIFPGYVPR